jgi:RNA polymerase sigma-70 factor (ECF subfamily)
LISRLTSQPTQVQEYSRNSNLLKHARLQQADRPPPQLRINSCGLPLLTASADGGTMTAACAADPDEELISAVSKGDQLAYTRLVNRHADAVFSYLVRMTRSSADAEDLLQETFFRVWRKAGSYQSGRVRVSTWIHRIAHNLFIDAFRSRRRLNETVDATLLSRELVDTEIARQQLALVETAIANLPVNQRAALLLCQTRGFSNAEAGEILGLQVRAVESLVARARRSLKAVISETEENNSMSDKT